MLFGRLSRSQLKAKALEFVSRFVSALSGAINGRRGPQATNLNLSHSVLTQPPYCQSQFKIKCEILIKLISFTFAHHTLEIVESLGH